MELESDFMMPEVDTRSQTRPRDRRNIWEQSSNGGLGAIETKRSKALLRESTYKSHQADPAKDYHFTRQRQRQPWGIPVINNL